MSFDFTPGKPLRAYDENGNWKDYSTDEIVGKQLNNYKNWLCGVGTENLFINPDGDIYGGSCKVGGKLGNIYDDFNIPEKWSTCTLKLCTCGSDLFIPKVKNEEYKHLLVKTNNNIPDGNKKIDQLNNFYGLERTHASNYKQIYWEIGRRCNYDCSYCWPFIHNNHERHKSLNELITATMKIQEKFIKGSKCNFIISGGEPTANSGFLDWCRYIHSFDYILSMHSNGSRKPEYYQELIKYGNLNLSAHYEFMNEEKFIDVVKGIMDIKLNKKIKSYHLEIKLMMKPYTREYTLNLENKLKNINQFNNYCTLAIVPIRDGNKGDQIMHGYDDEDFKIFGDRN